MLIDHNKKIGIVSLDDAIKSSEKVSLDLVQVSPSDS